MAALTSCGTRLCSSIFSANAGILSCLRHSHATLDYKDPYQLRYASDRTNVNVAVQPTSHLCYIKHAGRHLHHLRYSAFGEHAGQNIHASVGITPVDVHSARRTCNVSSRVMNRSLDLHNNVTDGILGASNVNVAVNVTNARNASCARNVRFLHCSCSPHTHNVVNVDEQSFSACSPRLAMLISSKSYSTSIRIISLGGRGNMRLMMNNLVDARHVCLKMYSSERLPKADASLTSDILKQCMPPPPSAQEISKSSVLSSTSSTSKTEDADAKDSKKKDSWFSTKNGWKLGLVSLGAMSVLMCGNLLVMWGAPTKDVDGEEIPDQFTELPKWQAYPRRAWLQFNFFKKMIEEPSSEKLLPDPLKEPYYQPPYTLVLEMTGVLVHPDWTLSTGWRFKKRPGVEYFLQQIGPPLFEVVIYTHEQGFTAFPIIDALDQHGFVMYRLFRDATRYIKGSHVKDLACLNRDLSKVIIVDCDSKAFQLHPRNAVLLKKWTGTDSDRTLLDLAAFLRTIAISDVEDVRSVLEYYSQFDDPLEAFKERQRIVQEQQDMQARQLQAQNEKKALTNKWSFGLTGWARR